MEAFDDQKHNYRYLFIVDNIILHIFYKVNHEHFHIKFYSLKMFFKYVYIKICFYFMCFLIPICLGQYTGRNSEENSFYTSCISK